MALGPGDGLQTWEFKVVRTLVAERRRRQRLSVEQAEDLLQECLLHWIQVRQRLSPQARDAGAKYLHRVIENFLADLTRKDLAAKRGSGIDPLSLDFPVGSMEDSDQEAATTLGQLLAYRWRSPLRWLGMKNSPHDMHLRCPALAIAAPQRTRRAQRPPRPDTRRLAV